MTFTRMLFTLSACLLAGAFARTAPAQPKFHPTLSVTRVWTQGALQIGNSNTIRATIQNSSQTYPAQGKVHVTLMLLDPDRKKTEYEAAINSIAARSQQSVAFRNVSVPKPGTYTAIVVVDPDGQFTTGGRYNNSANQRVETFTVGAADAGAPHRLIVTVKNDRGQTVNAVRVALKTADGKEIGWRNTAGAGQAQFPRVPPSPQGKPFTIEVSRFGQALLTQEFVMPDQDTTLELVVDPRPRAQQ